jgi:cytochrome c oxidase subunit 1
MEGNLQFPAMLFSIGMVSTFITGGLTGIILGDGTLDINVHDTYFVVAHFHLVMGYQLYMVYLLECMLVPRMYGRMMNKNMGYIHFFRPVCVWCVFFQCISSVLLGYQDVITQMNFPLFDDLQNVNVLITMFALIGGAFN